MRFRSRRAVSLVSVDILLILLLGVSVMFSSCQARNAAADYKVALADKQAEANNWELDYKFLANQVTILGNKQIELDRKVDEADAARDALILKQQLNDQGVQR